MVDLVSVPSELVSVVIQGPLYLDNPNGSNIHFCLSTIRQHLPAAEVIISTWLDEDVTGLDEYLVIQSVKPPAFESVTGDVNNINLQILSTKVGIEAASRPYVLKFRANLSFKGSAMAVSGRYMDHVPLERRLFREPVVVTNLFTRNPARVPMLFHLSDIVQFGRRCDLLDLWGCELKRREELLLERPRANPIGNCIGLPDAKMVPEQAIVLDWLNRMGVPARLNGVCEVKADMLETWERVLTDNFIVLDWDSSQVCFPQRFFSLGYATESVYLPGELERISSKLGTKKYFWRWQHVLLTKYVFCIFRKYWWLSMASSTLCAISPNLAKKVRTGWKAVIARKSS